MYQFDLSFPDWSELVCVWVFESELESNLLRVYRQNSLTMMG